MDQPPSLPPAITLQRSDYTSAPAPRPESAETPLEFWRLFRRRKGSLLLIASTGALLGFLSTLPQTPVYQARASIEIVGLNDNFLNIKQVQPVTETGTTSETAD